MARAFAPLSTILVELYYSLREAGASEETARAAAKAMVDYDSRFARVDADLLVLKCMTGAILAGLASLILRTFFGAG